jgi:hypothetical protein
MGALKLVCIWRSLPSGLTLAASAGALSDWMVM